MTGCQRILLIPPDQAFNGMYPYPVHHPYDTYSMVDLEKPDLGQWPHNADVKGLCCILKPGDVLYVPAYWYVLLKVTCTLVMTKVIGTQLVSGTAQHTTTFQSLCDCLASYISS